MRSRRHHSREPLTLRAYHFQIVDRSVARVERHLKPALVKVRKTTPDKSILQRVWDVVRIARTGLHEIRRRAATGSHLVDHTGEGTPIGIARCELPANGRETIQPLYKRLPTAIQDQVLDTFPVKDTRPPLPHVIDVVGWDECPIPPVPGSMAYVHAGRCEPLGKCRTIRIRDRTIRSAEQTRQGRLVRDTSVLVSISRRSLVPSTQKQKGGCNEIRLA
jgi:hypothetical protein